MIVNPCFKISFRDFVKLDGAEKMAEQYPLGKEIAICYKVSDNGAVHIASDTTATKKLMYAYAIAVGVEFAAFFIIWWMII